MYVVVTNYRTFRAYWDDEVNWREFNDAIRRKLRRGEYIINLEETGG